jgi:uroporphyrinogen-III synthase
MSTAGLLALPGLQAVEGERLLIVKGEGGREALQSELQNRGAAVETLACYRRLCPALEPPELARRLDSWGIEVVLISSGEGLANMLALLSTEETTKFRDMRLVVPSARVESLARQAGFSQVVTAANASDGAMMTALDDWIHSSGE